MILAKPTIATRGRRVRPLWLALALVLVPALAGMGSAALSCAATPACCCGPSAGAPDPRPSPDPDGCCGEASADPCTLAAAGSRPTQGLAPLAPNGPHHPLAALPAAPGALSSGVLALSTVTPGYPLSRVGPPLHLLNQVFRC
jgi:hypothetical protein